MHSGSNAGACSVHGARGRCMPDMCCSGMYAAAQQRQGAAVWMDGACLRWPHLVQQLDNRLDVIVCPLVMLLAQSTLRTKVEHGWACMP